MFGIIQRVTGCIDKMPVIGNKSFIGGFLNAGESNAHFGKDVVSWLNRAPSKGGFWNTLGNLFAPKPIRPLLAKAVSGFTSLPLMKRVSCWAQLNVGFDAVIGVFSALKETMNHGLKAGIKSFVQSAVMLAAYLGGSFALPAMLGISVTTMSGIIAGIVGGNIIQRQVEKVLGKSKADKEATETATQPIHPLRKTPQTPVTLVQTPTEISPQDILRQNPFQPVPVSSAATANPNIPL